MERQKARPERARRNRTTAGLLMQRKLNPQYRLHLIEQRQNNLSSEYPLPNQKTPWSLKELK